MATADVSQILSRISNLLEEFEVRVPGAGPRNSDFRADLAGLLVVLIAATYENCVKDILLRYAEAKNSDFGNYVGRRYQKINSQIRLSDLRTYAKNFDPTIDTKFKTDLDTYNKSILSRTGVDVKDCYNQILEWRHGFAHQGLRNVTLEEASKFHRYAQRVLIIFDASFG